MKGDKSWLAVIVVAMIMNISIPALASPDGLKDSHGVWRDSEYWHSRHPEWVYRYHPEWTVEREEWWGADHRAHPEWFSSPYWREYPIWTQGAYDRGHIWRSAGWWHERQPEWFYGHHPEWAGPHPEWIRVDHGMHPDWFRSPYWQEHPRDWAHPDEEYRRALDRNREYQHHSGGNDQNYGDRRHEGATAYKGEGYHANSAAIEHRNDIAAQPHTTYHASSGTYHASASTSASGSAGSHSSGGHSSGKH